MVFVTVLGHVLVKKRKMCHMSKMFKNGARMRSQIWDSPPPFPPKWPQGRPRVSQGRPKSPRDLLLEPQAPPQRTQGTILEPRDPLRALKAHKKAPQELSLVSFWDPGAHFCAQASIFPRCFRKSTIPGLIVMDLRNVTGRLLFCQRGFPDQLVFLSPFSHFPIALITHITHK